MDLPSVPDSSMDQFVLGKRKRSTGTLDEVDQDLQVGNASQNMDSVMAEPSLDNGTELSELPELSAKGSRTHDDDTASESGAIPATILPLEVLQHIFSFLDPTSLGLLLRVCRDINMLLDPRKDLPSSPATGRLRLLPQNDIWSISRRTFAPTTPRPMQDMTELDMWALIRGRKCQFCGRKPKGKAPVKANSPWVSGPGPEGVRPIWPFRVRSCGNCLKSHLVKDSELFLSTSSVLIPGLPFAIFSPPFNYVTSITLRHTQPPPSLLLTKFYFRPQIEALESIMVQTRALGEAALAEWYRGLKHGGQSHMADAARFEQWEANETSHGHLDPAPSYRMDLSDSTSSSASPTHSLSSGAIHSAQWSVASPSAFPASTPQHHGSQPASVFGSSTPSNNIPFQSLNMVASQQSPRRQPFPLGSFSPLSAGSQTGAAAHHRRKPEKNPQEIIKLKTERRAEIERRCLELVPPIRASTLTYMDAFNAAVQIPMPLNDQAWEALKPRLLAQRPDAEQKEADTAGQSSHPDASVMLTSKPGHPSVAELDPDQLWDEIRKDPQDKIKEYAEDYISSIWADGKSITKTTASKFAADVLLHVRRRFYETVKEEDDALEAKQIVIPLDSFPDDTRKLRLEHMRWIFQEAIRPHTERFGREIFLCSTCDTGPKRFSFDAVIQHYAAKHTTTLSHGNAVVHWKAEWPAEPPFHPAPDAVWNREPEHRPHPNAYPTSPPYFLGSGPSWMSPNYQAPASQPNGLYTVQSDVLITAALDAWDATDQIHGLPDSVRLYVIIHHAIVRLSQRFANEPPLSMFVDCINHRQVLSEMSRLGDLQCKSCLARAKESGQDPLGANLPRYLASELFDHFHKTHLEMEARGTPRAFGRPMSVDWKFDMIELPPKTVIRNLMDAPGINFQKLQVIAAVLPDCFPKPLPRIEPIPLEAIGPRRPSGPYSYSLGYRQREHRIVDEEPPPPRYVSAARHPDGQEYRQGYGRFGRHYELNEPAYEVNYDARRTWEAMQAPKIVYVEPPPHVLHEHEPMEPKSIRYDVPRVYEYNQTEQHVQRGRAEHRRSPEGASPRPKRRFSRAIDDEAHDERRVPPPLESVKDNRIEAVAPSPVKEQGRAVSPAPVDAVESFFNRFDSIQSASSTGNTPRRSVVGAHTPPRLASSARFVERGRRSHIGTPRGIHHSPPNKVSSQTRSRTDSPALPFEGRSNTPPRSATSRDMDYDRLPPARSPSPRSLPVPQPPYPRHGYEAYRNPDHNVDEYRGGYMRGRAYRAYEQHHVPKRYVEILPNGQQRIIEEIPAPPYEPVDYIRPSPEDYEDVVGPPGAAGADSRGRGGYYPEIPGGQHRDIRYVRGRSPGDPVREREQEPSALANERERHYQRRP